jgi:hypothetical protein
VKYKLPLVVSLTLNVILVGAFFFAPEHESATRELPPAAPPSSLRQPRVVSESEQNPVSAKASPSHVVDGPVWQQSLPQLRDAGVPNDVLAGLVIADFEIQWQKQLQDFEQRYQAGAVDDNERARFEARRDEEQEQALRTALGDEGFRQWDKTYSLRDLDLVKLQLSSPQTDALYQLRKDRALKDRMLAEALRNGAIDEADYNKQQAAAQQEYDLQFQMVLGDERYKALQNSEEGMEGALRQRLKDVNSVHDSQLEVMVEAERKWNQRRAELDRRSKETPDQRQAYEEQARALDVARDQEYKQVLATNDFDQLQRNQDRRYQLLKRHAITWSLSDSDIDYIYSSVRHYREKNQHARSQIEQSLISYLGQERFDRLKNNDLFALVEQ